MPIQEPATFPHEVTFELVQKHESYIEFSVSYRLEYNQWTAEGIGWVSNGLPAYYLHSLKLNNFPAARHYESKAQFVEQELSLKFQSSELEVPVLMNIKQQFSCLRRRKKR